MTKKTIMALALATIAAGTGAASAHTSFEIADAVSEKGFKAVLQVPHGCDGKATTEVRITLPEGFIAAKPQPKPGWELEILKGPYARTYDNHGEAISQGPVEIRWRGGNLPDEYYDTFVVTGRFSGFAAPTSVAFPVTQLCGATDNVVWDEIAAEGQNPHALAHPAPTITVSPASDAGHGEHQHGAQGDDMAGMPGMSAASGAQTGEDVTVGPLHLSSGGVKAMIPGAKVAGGGLTIRNDGAEDDRLVSVESPSAGRVELHEMTMENDVMKMRKIEDGIAIPAGQTVSLKSGGLHLMFFEIPEPFAEGQVVPLTLTFEKAGKVEYSLPVGGASGASGSP